MHTEDDELNDWCPHCQRPYAQKWGQNREDATDQVYGHLRERFYELWKSHYPKLPLREMGPEIGHARGVCRKLLTHCLGDIAEARAMSRVLADNMFLDDNLNRDGLPWLWRSVEKNVPRFFMRRRLNVAREARDTADADAFQLRMDVAGEQAAPADVGREMLAALKRK